MKGKLLRKAVSLAAAVAMVSTFEMVPELKRITTISAYAVNETNDFSLGICAENSLNEVEILSSTIVDSGVYGDNNNIIWEFTDNGTLTISGNDILTGAYVNEAWDPYRDQIKEILISGNFTSINSYVFYSLSSLTTVTITAPVEVIGEGAFCNNKSLESVTLPNGLSVISVDSFKGCTSLKEINFPQSLKKINDRAFLECKSLSGKIEFNEGLLYIGGNAFRDTAISELVIPGTVETIDTCAFQNAAVSKIWLKNGIINIEKYAFKYCEMSEIIMPDSVVYVGDEAFYGCKNLKTCIFGKGIQQIGNYVFSACNNLEVLGGYYNTAFEDLEKEDTYNSISFSYFGDASDSVIDSGAIGSVTWTYNSNGILEFSGSGVIAENGERPYSKYLKTAKQIIINKGFTGIAEGAFKGAQNITEITVPEGVIFIKSNAFSGCSKLEKISLPSTLSTFDCIQRDDSSVDIISMPYSLKSINVDPHNTNFISYDGVLYNYSGTELIFCPASNNASTFRVPEGIETIKSYAFYAPSSYAANNNLVKIIMPTTLKKIEDFAIYFGQQGNVEIELNDGLLTIGKGAIGGCGNSIIVPSTVKNIGECGLGTYLSDKGGMMVKNGFIVYGYKNSAAEHYVNTCPSDYNVTFVSIGEINNIKPQITKTIIGNGQIGLNWSAIDGAAQYAVYYRANGGIWVMAGKRTETGMYVRGLTNGTKYGFAVKAYVNGAWTGITSSDIVYATPTAPVTKPKITKTIPGNGQVGLNWSSVSGAKQYAVYYKTGSTWTLAGKTTALGMYVRGLTNGTKYGFAVKAYVNGAWTGITSSDIVYAAPTAPTAKPVITKTIPGDGQVGLNWTSVSGAKQYAVYYRTGSTWTLAGKTTSIGMYVRGLTNGTKYGFAVKAYVNGAWTTITSSDIVYATPTAAKSSIIDIDPEDIEFFNAVPMIA